MKKTIKLIEVQTPSGQPMFQFRISETILTEEEAAASSKEYLAGRDNPKDPADGNKRGDGGGKKNTGAADTMTDPQKKYLFRIMAVQGKEGDDAHEELKRLFQAKTLKDVTKLDASRMIEELLEKEKQGNGGGDGSPF